MEKGLINIDSIIRNCDPDSMSPLALAYIGDTVYDLYVRTHLVSGSHGTVSSLHKQAVSFVNCGAQSAGYKKIKDKLSDDEITVFKRGRNTKSTVPKNADASHYRNATGLEALIGYIFLKGGTDRLNEIMNLILE